jgi:hypothetical protein
MNTTEPLLVVIDEEINRLPQVRNRCTAEALVAQKVKKTR